LAGRKFGLDPGTMNLRICQNGHGLIVNEKNLIAVQKKNIIAVGNEAYDMFERTPASIKIAKPVRDGVIADIDLLSKATEMILRKNSSVSSFMRNNHFYIAVPTDVTEVEKRAYFNLIMQSSFNTRHVYLVEKPIAVAIGENLAISGEDPIMTVDMGAGSTEISIMMMNGIVVSRLLKEGGFTINENICRAVKEEYSLLIGEKTAEYLKFELGNAIPDSKRTVVAYGRDLITGMPSHAEIPVSLVFEAMKTYFIHVVKTVHNMIGKVPPAQAAFIMQHGIFFTGGASMTPKLPELFESILQLPVKFSESPADSAIRGIAKMMQNPSAYRNMNFSIKEASFE